MAIATTAAKGGADPLLEKGKPRVTGGRKARGTHLSQPGCRKEMTVSVGRCEDRPKALSVTQREPAQASKPLTHRGFTLLEAVTVLAVVGVITTIVVGGLEILRKSSFFTGTTGDLITSLRKTRAEAFG